jgi:hypothetical protein
MTLLSLQERSVFEKCQRFADRAIEDPIDPMTAQFLVEMNLDEKGVAADPALSSVFKEMWDLQPPLGEEDEFRLAARFLVAELVDLRGLPKAELSKDLRSVDAQGKGSPLWTIWQAV